jgi:glucokinase
VTPVGALESKSCLSIDVGGTKIATAIVDGAGNVLARNQIASTDAGSADELFARVVASATDVLESVPVAPDVCGVGCGGPGTDRYRVVSPLNIAAWRSFPIGDRVGAAFGLPTFCENDAKALTLGEGWKGAAVGVRNFVGMVVSTGVGGGIVLEGRLLQGHDGNAGHIGHVFVDPDGYADAAGARGGLEGQASGSAIAAITGRPPSEADQGTRRRVGVLVGRAVASVANLLDLQLAVVAGSVALGFGQDFFEPAQATIDELCRIEYSRGTRIISAGLGADAPLVGAAAVGFSGLGYDLLYSAGG